MWAMTCISRRIRFRGLSARIIRSNVNCTQHLFKIPSIAVDWAAETKTIMNSIDENKELIMPSHGYLLDFRKAHLHLKLAKVLEVVGYIKSVRDISLVGMVNCPKTSNFEIISEAISLPIITPELPTKAKVPQPDNPAPLQAMIVNRDVRWSFH